MMEVKSIQRSDIIMGLEVWGGIIVLMGITIVLLMRPPATPMPAVVAPTLVALPTVTPWPTATPFPTPTAMLIFTPEPLSTALPVADEDAATVAESPALAQPRPATYIVQAGDTLSDIAERFDISTEVLMVFNDLNDELLSLEQELAIPSEDEGRALAVASAQNPVRTVYTVRAGDTLGAIANRYGIQVAALRETNNLNSDMLSLGQELVIPNTDAERALAVTSAADISRTVYVVESGDTLGAIANRYGIQIAALREANGLNSDMLQLGQELVIPEG